MAGIEDHSAFKQTVGAMRQSVMECKQIRETLRLEKTK